MSSIRISKIKSLEDDINYIKNLLAEVESTKDHTIDTETPAKALRTALKCMNKEMEKLTHA